MGVSGHNFFILGVVILIGLCNYVDVSDIDEIHSSSCLITKYNNHMIEVVCH